MQLPQRVSQREVLGIDCRCAHRRRAGARVMFYDEDEAFAIRAALIVIAVVAWFFWG